MPKHVEAGWYILRLTAPDDFLMGAANWSKTAKSIALWSGSR
tara:strand:- start:214 stop:339 length:126 start_codon:yes stop_codon:yes gene_type:complete